MFRMDLGIEDGPTRELLQSLCSTIEECGLAAVLEALDRASRLEDCIAPPHFGEGDRRVSATIVDLLIGADCNVLPAEKAGGLCKRLLIAISKGRTGKLGSTVLLDAMVRHLAVCGCSVDGEPPNREPTRFAIFLHDELDMKAFRERHRPTLEAFRSRGVRIVMLHVDSTNRITWVERDLAETPALAL